MNTTGVILSYREYAALPADGRRHEIHDGVPYFWLVDPEARAIEAYALGPQGYSLTLRSSGTDPASPQPFANLDLIPDTLWP
jgi:Uma2 family endonuclease